ncbi:MAG: hypothetical protein Fur0020_05150 [Thermodesulfovibrionia bacterium]
MEKVDIELCSICAWRANCQKKFSISGKDMRCPDFTRDVSISEIKEEKAQPRQSPETP